MVKFQDTKRWVNHGSWSIGQPSYMGVFACPSETSTPFRGDMQKPPICESGGWVVWIEPASPTKGERTPAWNRLLDSIERAVAQRFFRKPDDEKLKHNEEEDGDPHSEPSLSEASLIFPSHHRACGRTAQLGGSPQIIDSMETLFSQSEPLKVIKTSSISIPLSTASSVPGFLLTEQYRALRSQLMALRPVLVAGGTSADLFDFILQGVLNEFNIQAVVSQWKWKMISGQKQ